jgi:hypothetical protein
VETTQSIIKEIAFRTFISFLCCTIFGYMFWKGSVFNLYHSAFQFIAYGTIGSIFFYTLRFGVKNAIGVLLFTAVMLFGVVMKTHGMFAIRDLFVTIAIASTIYIYFTTFHNQTKLSKIFEPLVLAFLFSLSNFIVILLTGFIIYGHGGTLSWVYEITKHFFLIGLGIGIGIILTEEPYSEKIRAKFHNFIS